MYRDLKLGLALAVLLIGSTAAFFFRGEVDPDAGLPQLQDPERIDGEIALRGVAPYLKNLETDPAEPTPSPWSKPAFLGGTVAASLRRSVTPDPIQIVMEEELPESGPVLSQPPSVPSGREDGDGAAFHVVRPGDTLTGLAARYLGSLARYHEIYELNRDQLAGPDSLRVGMRLRLPLASTANPPSIEASTPAAATPPSPEADAMPPLPSPTVAQPDEGARPEGKSSPEKLFVPAKKPPFIPGRYRSTPAVDPKDAAI